jgi:hypothetical protein
MVTSFLLVTAAGVMVGWLIGVLSDATEPTRHGLDDQPTPDDLVNWDQHTKGGRRG